MISVTNNRVGDRIEVFVPSTLLDFHVVNDLYTTSGLSGVNISGTKEDLRENGD